MFSMYTIKMGYIYRLLNLITGQMYIGQTKNLQNRKACHRKNYEDTDLAHSVREYGFDNFVCEIIIICFDEDLLDYEEYYIKKYDTFETPHGLNLTTGGRHPKFSQKSLDKMRGSREYTHTEEWKKNMSELMTGRVFSPETIMKMKQHIKSAEHRANISRAITGRTLSPEHIEKMRNRVVSIETREKLRKAKLGKKQTEESKEKTRKALTGIKRSAETIAKAYKKVYQYNLDGTFRQEWESLKSIEEKIGIGRTGISAVCRGIGQTAGGYKWSFVPPVE